jgi:phospholipid/cholesterol/gamma-HCH transport system ATP-binding protein
MAAMVSYEDVWKSFDEPVLQGVSLEVAEGEILSLVGTSGGGKSVLLKLALGLLLPDAGEIHIDGVSVPEASTEELEEVRRKVGYVFQNAALFDSMTVFANVAQGLRETELGAISEEDLEGRVNRALEEVNLEPESVAEKIPSELSGGMRKRVGLARALIGEARVLLYDEPVTGLDPVNAALVERLVTGIRERRGVTSIIVTHDIPGALGMSDRIALLDEGKVHFLGTPDAFLRSTDPVVRAFADRQAAARLAKAGAGAPA